MYQSKCQNCGEPNFFTVPPADRVKCTSCGNTFRTSAIVEASESTLEPRAAASSPEEPEMQAFPLLSNRFSLMLSFMSGAGLAAIVVGRWAGMTIRDEHFHIAFLWLSWGTLFFLLPYIGKWDQAIAKYMARTATNSADRQMWQNNQEALTSLWFLTILILGGVCVWKSFFPE